MRVLIGVDNYCAHYYINLGMAQALTYSGHEVIMWDIHKKTTYDAFDEFNPDLFIFQSYNITDAIAACIKERPNMRVIMKAGDWGEYSDTLDRVAYPLLFASKEEVGRVNMLKLETGKPDYVYIHYHPNWRKQTHGKWEENGVKVVNLMNAADIFTYCNGKSLPEFHSDICFVGGYWGYKSKNLDKYILPLCKTGNLNIKIFGNQPWPVNQFCGFIEDELVRDLFSSAKICPNISEPHSTDLGFDIIERPFKLMAAKAFVISDYVEGLTLLYPDNVYAKTPDEFFNHVDYYLGQEQRRKEIALEGYYNTIAYHTYFDRCSDMFDALGEEKEVENINKSKQKALKELDL